MSVSLSTMEHAEPVAAETDDSIRANAYSLLAALLAAPPKDEVLDLLRQIDAGDDAGDEFAAAWRGLREAARACDSGRLDDEYHTLLIGVGRGELVPYASWYLTGFLMDQPLARLRQDLARLGIERQARVYETEDHAAAICEIMAILIGNNGEESIESQRAFFEEHVGSWMDAFFEDLQRAESADFYCAVGRLGVCFMKLEKTYLSMLV